MALVLSHWPRSTATAAEPGAFEELFQKPPADARPHTWWHWMNGNISAAGITRDLEAMARVGIGGVQIFDVGTGIPKGPIVSLSPEWFALMKHAAAEADRLGLSLTLHNCPGWSSTGGPWVTPELAMQQVVWSETFVSGGKTLDLELPQPITNLDFYRDAAVIAFPSLAGETRAFAQRVAGVKANGEAIDIRRLTDFGTGTSVQIRPQNASSPAYLEIEFQNPYEARAISVHATSPNAPRFGQPPMLGLSLESSQDGRTYTPVAALNGGSPFGRGAEFPATAQFPVVKARYFRIACALEVEISEVDISASDRVPDWVYKTNAARKPNQEQDLTPRTVTGAIDSSRIVDLTSHVQKGRLNWRAPAGNWTILRIGHTPTGRRQNASTDTGLGLEIDKYSRLAMDFHFARFFGPLLDGLQPLIGKRMAGALIDSYEVGMQNWTPAFDREFARRRGYDMIMYLPAMTGRFVDGAESTERFLWDLRRTQADLIADNYWGRFTELCHEKGLISHTEPYGPGSGPMDEQQVGARVDHPMGEFWLRTGNLAPTMKVAASIAHVHAKPIVGAESFTGRADHSKWTEYPFALKAQGDLMFTSGLQNVIFHRYAHQPQHPDVVPGMTMGPWGMHFDRTNTWWEQSAPWLRYLARCQHMLRQGKFVADLLYFAGESSPLESRTKGWASSQFPVLTPTPPDGHDYDLCDVEALLTRTRVDNSRIVLPDAMEYRVFVLPDNTRYMSLPVLRRLTELVGEGMWLVGAPPTDVYGLGKKAENQQEMRRLTTELWGNVDGKDVTERSFGRGRVIWGQSLSDVLSKAARPADFSFTSTAADAAIHYVHRRSADADIYFVCNRQRRAEEVVCSFRIDGKRPEIFDPDSGRGVIAPVYDAANGTVTLPLRLEAAGSVFVVFRSAAESNRLTRITLDDTKLLEARPVATAERLPHANVANDFTVTCWVKPECDLSINTTPGALTSTPGTSAPYGIGQETTQGDAGFAASSFVWYPPEGDAMYGDNHAAAGLVVARNVIAVFERARDYFPSVLVARTAISGWSHVALVYRGGAPTVYLNGRLLRTGQTSGRTIHPGLGAPMDRAFGPYFEGDLEALSVSPRALNEGELIQQVQAGPPASAEPFAIEPVFAADRALLVWKNGRYGLHGSSTSRVLEISNVDPPIALTGSWRVGFQSGRGAPAEVIFEKLTSLHRHTDAGVKYFSGTASYRKDFTLARSDFRAGKRLYLDLGRVEVVVRVVVNGRDLGTHWKRPFRIDVTDAVRSGGNALQVDVTNLWPNRLIGDEQQPQENDYSVTGGNQPGGIKEIPRWFMEGKTKPASPRLTFATWKHYASDSPLLESGLIGPVVIRTAVGVNHALNAH